MGTCMLIFAPNATNFLSLSLSLYLIPFIHSLEVYVDTYSDKPPYEEDFLAHEFLWSARGMVPKQGTGID